MSDPVASYSFIPWLRRGVSTRIARVDDGVVPAQPQPRPVLTFDLGFNNGALNASVDLNLAGPGEVGSLDPLFVIRRIPENDVNDAEPNLFPALEINVPELPWTYTAAKADASTERLTPWCALICVKVEEISEYRAAGVEGQLAVVRVDGTVLPIWNQCWAWAHVQVSGTNMPTADQLRLILNDEPERIIARFLCPRRLDAQSSYRAFLVPTFERGRLAGLRRELAETLDAVVPAWNSTSRDLELPVLYEWRFQTGLEEDFEYLVRQLKPFVAPPEVGRRDMSVLDPGLGLPQAAGYPLALEGALRAIGSESTDWKLSDKQPFQAALTSLLNLPEDQLNGTGPDVPIVAPTLYGRWHALENRLSTAVAALPKWFHQLNGDPRLRVAAALGTMVIQDQQRQLMAAAWQQVGPIREINEERRKKQMAQVAAGRIYEREWKYLDAEKVLLSAGPVLSRIQASPHTVLKALRGSPIPPAVLDPQLKRIARPLGPLGRRQGRHRLQKLPPLLGRINKGELLSRAQPPVPTGIVTPQKAGVTLPGTTPLDHFARFLSRVPWWVFVVAALIWIALFAAGVPTTILAPLLLVLIAIAVTKWQYRWTQQGDSIVAGTLTAADVRAASVATRFVPSVTPAVGGPPPPPSHTSGGEEPSAAAIRFKEAAARVLNEARRGPSAAKALVALDLPTISAKVLVALDPAVTIGAGTKERVKTLHGAVQPADPLDEVMAAPEFPQPMYEPIRDLGQDWLLPGLEFVPSNVVCLLESNSAGFIEPYMVGLSHEMARELLWNEYPTDQRGTYFRQFWDVRGYVPPPGESVDPEKLKDVKPIHLWDHELGVNSSQLPPGGKHLVLLIRGEVLRRWPNTIIYAARAKAGAGGMRALDTEERHPVFRGTLKPDVTFFGFELTEGQARGGGSDPGWFFVLQEHPTEPRFGLDIKSDKARPESWNDLAWRHLASGSDALNAITYIDLGAALPDTTLPESDPNGPVWHVTGGRRGSRSSDLAYATLQVPVRIVIHASELLPATGGGAR